MICGKRVLGVITARGGSKGIPKKNIRIAGGMPLIAWTIRAAQQSRYLDRVIVSTDDREIISTAIEYRCEVPFVRSERLAQDDTPSIDVIIDALDRCPGYDWVVLLQPTSPLRTAADIDGAVERCAHLDAPACVSVCESEQSPFLMFTLQGFLLHSVTDLSLMGRRQDMPRAYVLNGAIYVASIEWIRRMRAFVGKGTVAYEMPRERSLDIDEEADLAHFSEIVARAKNA